MTKLNSCCTLVSLETGVKAIWIYQLVCLLTVILIGLVLLIYSAPSKANIYLSEDNLAYHGIALAVAALLWCYLCCCLHTGMTQKKVTYLTTWLVICVILIGCGIFVLVYLATKYSRGLTNFDGIVLVLTITQIVLHMWFMCVVNEYQVHIEKQKAQGMWMRDKREEDNESNSEFVIDLIVEEGPQFVKFFKRLFD